MAAGSGHRKRKRKRKTPEASERRQKLLLGENVEVLQLDEGLKGSWHAGVVVGLAEESRLIEYRDMLSDDKETKLVEVVSVSAAVEGFPRGGGSKNYHGRIRPSPQSSHVQASEITYGLCVDAFIDDAWWEGVVFDHKEGASSRLIFFPDLGDQETVGADRLRVTHDWNEVSGKWNHRGNWLLLQELQEFEQEDALPVSIREIWYDLRSTASFIRNIGLWMAGSPPAWHALLSELIHELRFVVDDDQPVAAVVAENPVVAVPMTLPAADVSAQDIIVHLQNEAPLSDDCFHGSGDSSFNGAVKFGVSGTTSQLPYKSNGDNSDTESESWPHALSEYVAEYGRTGASRGSHLRQRLKKLHQKAECYLSAIGWQSRRNKYGFKCYVSPDGTVYKSMILACQALKSKEFQMVLHEDDDDNKSLSCSDANIDAETNMVLHDDDDNKSLSCSDANIDTETNMVLHDDDDNKLSCSKANIDTETNILQANESPDNETRGAASSWQPLCLQPEFCSEAITLYACKSENKHPRNKVKMSEKVKKHLLALGWKVEFRRGDYLRIRCFSPEGKKYCSLLKACCDLVNSGELEGSNAYLLHSNTSSDRRLDHSCYIEHKEENAPQNITKVGNLNDGFPVHKNCPWPLSLPPNKEYFSRKVLSSLFDKGIVLPRQKVSYKKDGLVITEGRLTRNGIKCKCCTKLYSPTTFANHAGSDECKNIENIFLEDGRSLLQCQMQMAQSGSPQVFSHPRLKTMNNLCPTDTICSFCRYGGKLMLCDHCPSAFHPHCVGLKNVPKGNWFCPSCQCSFCGFTEFNNDVEHLTEQTMVFCDQCERPYHIGCRSKGATNSLKCFLTSDRFCSNTCSKIFLRLRKLVGKSRPTSKEGISWSVLRSTRGMDAEYGLLDLQTAANHQKKLDVALSLLHECFTAITEARTKSDLFADIMLNKESELNRLNFWGFYTMLLERGDEVISVATFRVFGEKMAEMPLVATHPPYRGQGMCRLILHELEKLLSSLGVERLCIPAVPQLLGTWTSSFGFTKMSISERMDFLEYTFLNFQDTAMCQKLLGAAQEIKLDQTGNGSTGNSETSDPYVDNPVIENVELHKALPCLGSGACYIPAKPDALKETHHQSHIAYSPANSSCSYVNQHGTRREAIEVASSRPEDSSASMNISPPVIALCSLLNRTVDNLKCKFP